MIGFSTPASSNKSPPPQPTINNPLPSAPSILGYPASHQPTTTTTTDGSSTSTRDLTEDEYTDSLLRCVEARDLMSYGMIPEFVGRFPVIVSLNHLDIQSLVSILSQPKNALIPQFKSLFKMDQVNMSV